VALRPRFSTGLPFSIQQSGRRAWGSSARDLQRYRRLAPIRTAVFADMPLRESMLAIKKAECKLNLGQVRDPCHNFALKTDSTGKNGARAARHSRER
jgi:hypothetical protein